MTLTSLSPPSSDQLAPAPPEPQTPRWGLRALRHYLLVGGAQQAPYKGGFFRRGGGSCAVGAIYQGATGKTRVTNIEYLRAEILSRTGVDLMRIVPYRHQHGGSSLFNSLIYLNDKCGWSRAQIAEWLEQLAEQEESYDDPRC